MSLSTWRSMTVTTEHNTLYGQWLYKLARAMPYETRCQGCFRPFSSMRNQAGRGQVIAVITDSSGSEQTHAHDDLHCMTSAILNDLK